MFNLPETLPATAAELNALLDSARADIHVIQARHAAQEPLGTDDVTRLRSLLEAVDTLSAATAEASTSETDHASELNSLLQRAQASAVVTELPAEPVVEDAPVIEAAPSTPELVTAAVTTGGNRPVSFAGLHVNSGPPSNLITPGTPGWRMHPTAPGYTEGMGKVGFAQIAEYLDGIRPGSRTARNPNTSGRQIGNVEYSRQIVASLDRISDIPVVENGHALLAAITQATTMLNGKRVTAASLTAAGGWCAPSEQLYDFCDVPDATDLISLPEFAIRRGGVRWPVEPDLTSIFEDFEWFFTETQLEAVDGGGAPTAIKNCVEIPCVDTFAEIRLNAVGYCIEAGILQEQGWPELVEWFMRSIMQEHLRALSRRTVLNIVSGSGSAKVIPPTSVMGSVASVLNSLALLATNLRLKRGLSRSATIEGVAPSWFFEVLRADLAMREGTDTFAVTDAQILSWLAARNIYLQYVGDWQTRSTGLPGHADTLQWPGTVDVVMYPAGTWFRSMSQVIELGVMYPKEQLQVNRFTRVFTEDALAVGKRCNESWLARIPLCVSGAVGGRVDIACADAGNSVNTVTITGTPTGGNWDALFSSGGGEAGTAPVSALAIAFNASAANVKTALVAMDDRFGASDFTVTGGALPGTPVVITYPKQLGTLSVAGHLTGGSSPAVAVS